MKQEQRLILVRNVKFEDFPVKSCFFRELLFALCEGLWYDIIIIMV